VAKGFGPTTFASLEREAIDWQRFQNRKQIGSYIGCCPSEFSTGNKQKLGSIDRQGNRRMRTLLVEAVWRLKKWNPTWRGFKKFPHVFGAHAMARGATRKERSWPVLACSPLICGDCKPVGSPSKISGSNQHNRNKQRSTSNPPMNTLGSRVTDRSNEAGRPQWPGCPVRMVVTLPSLLIRVASDTVHCRKSRHVRIGVCLASLPRNKPNLKPREELPRSLTN
jgi:hypothetical protein